MAVGYITASQSHASGSASTSQASFNWSHANGATAPRGVLVFTFHTPTTGDIVTGVTYGTATLTAVPSGRATDTATEPGDCKAWFCGSGIPTGTQTVTVTRTNDTSQVWAVCITVSAAADTETYGVQTQNENGTFAAISVDDGSPGTDSMRFAGGYSGGSNVLAAATGSSVIGQNDLGVYTDTVARESTAGQGARNVGFTYATSDDRAYVALAVREAVPAPDTAPSLITYGETDWNGTTATKATPSVSWLAGDLIVALGMCEDAAQTVGTPTATGLTFSPGTGVGTSGSTCWANSFTATAAADGSSAVSATLGGTGGRTWGLGVWVFRGSDGAGVRATDITTAKTVSLTRGSDHSLVVGVQGDYSAASSSGYSFTPTVGNDRQHLQVPTRYTAYVADWADQGTAGATSYGTSGETSSGTFAKLALEIKGTYTGGGGTTYDKAGGAASAGAAIGGETVIHATTYTKAGGGCSRIRAIGAKGVEHADAGGGSSRGLATGGKTVTPATTYTKAGGAASAGAAIGAETVSQAGAIVKTGGGSSRGLAVGGETVTHATTYTKAGGGASRGRGIAGETVTHATTYAKAGAGCSRGLAIGAETVVSAGAIVKAGGGCSRTRATGARSTDRARAGGSASRTRGSGARASVINKAGAGCSRGLGFGVITHAIRNKAGGAAAAGTGAGAKSRDKTKAGGAAARCAASGDGGTVRFTYGRARAGTGMAAGASAHTGAIASARAGGGAAALTSAGGDT